MCTFVLYKRALHSSSSIHMTNVQKSLITAAIIATLGTGAFGAATALAASKDSARVHEPMQSLVTAITEKFHLNESEVQAVFDAQKEKQEERRGMSPKERIAEAVENGMLTQAQADAIVAKIPEQKAFLKSLEDMEKSDRKAALEKNMTELEAWAEENDIPAFLLKFAQPGAHGPRGEMRSMHTMK